MPCGLPKEQLTLCPIFAEAALEGSCQTYGPCSPAGDGSYLMFFDGIFPRSAEPATGQVGNRPVAPPLDAWPTAEVDGGSFYLMADGHVQWLVGSHVSSGADASNENGVQTGEINGQAAGTANQKYLATFSTR